MFFNIIVIDDYDIFRIGKKYNFLLIKLLKGF